ncbi:HAMP domain-containing histidine kinase [Pedobacter sp. ISL-68]|uniref:sensor histidine kinase n=1 Tax=unclassified Pedobacter TaxID=2628915 RepID=UPI001BE51877|nr:MULTISPECIES: HAMP domain-containing sensor histidine kinase [unclassified Pedobacter]MBT2562029.1 HAMP domain-containing histidine kinase [Pedobacter sp. ISL-64]MBT2591616.1 HAMP domain-containing histidine kinase [Pedobacter sp. ISL-68]
MQYEKADNMIPSDETLRLEKLRYYEILGTPAESAFDQIAQLAAEIFDVPNAGIGFQTDGEIFMKAQLGLSIGLPIKSEAFTFFASTPISSPEGYHIGLIYVADTKFKTAEEQQLKMLKHLAGMVMEKLESRIAARKAFRAYDDRLHVLIHDLKNPMTTISLQSELLGRIPGIDDKAALIAGKINAQSKRMIDNLNGILSAARKEANSFKPKKDKVDLKEILEHVKLGLNLALQRKNQIVLIDIKEPVEIFADPDKLAMVFGELINNAIKFSPMGEKIYITNQTAENAVTISIKDNGVGLTEEDLRKVFMKFAQLSSVSTNQENTYGLGLITVNALVDIHKGKLWVESKGKNLGTTFYVTLPIK